jgi:hypothetical protein
MDVCDVCTRGLKQDLALLNPGMIRPPSPPTLGGTNPQSPPALGDSGGAKYMGFQDSYFY